MTTAVIGLGYIGIEVARNLVAAGEPVVLVARDPAKSEALASELGELATSASAEAAVEQSDSVVLAIYMHSAQALLPELGDKLVGKVVIDPSNPVEVTEAGELARTLPEGQTSGAVISALLPEGAHFAKAFGTLPAAAIGTARNQAPELAALFYTADSDFAAIEVERVIRASGFEPVRVEGDHADVRLEAGGDLNGLLISASAARAAL